MWTASEIRIAKGFFERKYGVPQNKFSRNV